MENPNHKAKEFARKMFTSVGKASAKKAAEAYKQKFGKELTDEEKQKAEQGFISNILNQYKVKRAIENMTEEEVLYMFEVKNIDEIKDDEIAELAQKFCDEEISTIEYEDKIIYPM